MKKLILLSTAVMLTLLTGCTMVRQTSEIPAAVAAKKNEDGYKLSRTLLEKFIKNDARGFVKLLPATLRKEFDVARFAATRKAIVDSMGTPVSFRYLGLLEMTTVSPHIWVVRFERVNEKENKKYYSEVLFRVYTGPLDKKTYIIGFNFL